MEEAIEYHEWLKEQIRKYNESLNINPTNERKRKEDC